jgi:hypothetical protein
MLSTKLLRLKFCRHILDDNERLETNFEQLGMDRFGDRLESMF